MKKLAALAIVACLALVTTEVQAQTVVDLIADGGDETTMVDVGSVTVERVGDFLNVTYEIEDSGGSDWVLIETHVHVGETLLDFPLTKKGNPKVGNFGYSNDHDPDDELKVFEYQIPLTWDPGDTLLIAAHASVWDKADFSGEELVVNGDFEASPTFPDQATGTWGYYVTTLLGGWNIAHTFSTGNEYPPTLEIWDNLMGPAYSGFQHVELDSTDPTDISQGLSTTEGFLYQLTYAWRPRPDEDCDMDVSVDSSVVASHAGVSGDWTAETYQFLAAGSSTTIGFAEVGADDELGMLLDTVSLRGAREETAWGGTWGDPTAGELNIQFADKKSWAAYFEYEIPLPDLIVSDIALDSATITDGDYLAFTYTVENIGGEGPIGNSEFDVAGYLSTDAVLDGSDTMILGPGGSSGTYSAWSFHLDVGWSNSVHVADGEITAGPGTYYLIMDADSTNAYPGVVESDENNNSLDVQFTVVTQ